MNDYQLKLKNAKQRILTDWLHVPVYNDRFINFSEFWH